MQVRFGAFLPRHEWHSRTEPVSERHLQYFFDFSSQAKEILDAIIPPNITSSSVKAEELLYHVRYERPQSIHVGMGANGSYTNGVPDTMAPCGMKTWITHEEVQGTALCDKIGAFLVVRSASRFRL